MELRFKWPKFTKRSTSILLGTITFSVVLNLATGISLWISFIISTLIIFLALLAIVLSRRPAYYSFIENIGDSISSEEFHKEDYVMSLNN